MASPASDRIQHGRRQLALALPLLACGLVVPSVHAKADVQQSSQILMGTRVDLTLQGNDSAALAAAATAAFTEMNRLADMMSRYRVTSALNAINLMAGLQPVPVPPELLRVLLMARQAGQASGGAFDATVGSLRDWDFSPEHPSIPSKQQIAAQLRLVDQKAGLVISEHAGTAYLTQRGMLLDLGGIAKLPILQAGLGQLQSRGVTNAMINGGGDVLVMGRLNGRPWRVGLRDPRQPSQLLGVVSLTQGFVAASGDYERFMMHDGKRLHHILDPKTGYPSTGPHGVTLISEQLELINGLGAALMVAGADAGRTRVGRTPGIDALIVDADSSLWLSPGMAQRFKRS
ncbi:ApbE-like lipoprotein [Rhodoferax ferrireducens T118]|uniref:FAD:protein FMN transferase n=1 Tax=Albidiferax ferrireducens (strain ATCC BAA-621 / DSM 15236 / T118) TaxID=338969 RepID=Q21TJ8_ALBFT|nr:FAD:protein FMN transferase [Rhodoferax ferrireducens]ABD70905.1 ApbE-like lipoprotein [Rhodoferax ferrireducens T118]